LLLNSSSEALTVSKGKVRSAMQGSIDTRYAKHALQHRSKVCKQRAACAHSFYHLVGKSSFAISRNWNDTARRNKAEILEVTSV
jgi:hypothetical protein